jgi:Protein of unknown function (DUF2934)
MSNLEDAGFSERVRLRAYLLWESDGCRDGAQDHFWHLAEAIEHREQIIDEEAQESFPASDPPSHTASNGPRIR